MGKLGEIFDEMAQGVFNGINGGAEVRVQTINSTGTAMQSSLCQAPCTVTIETTKRNLKIEIRADGTLGRVSKHEK